MALYSVGESWEHVNHKLIARWDNYNYGQVECLKENIVVCAKNQLDV
jgi:hypothetical protein